jgi:hypothetical protein
VTSGWVAPQPSANRLIRGIRQAFRRDQTKV